MNRGMKLVRGFLSFLGITIFMCVLVGVPMLVLYFVFGGSPLPDTSTSWAWYLKIGVGCLVIGAIAVYLAFMFFVLFEFMLRWNKRMQKIEHYLSNQKNPEKNKKKKNKETTSDDLHDILE